MFLFSLIQYPRDVVYVTSAECNLKPVRPYHILLYFGSKKIKGITLQEISVIPWTIRGIAFLDDASRISIILSY